MPITPTNITKHSITPATIEKGGYVLWGDPVITWGDIIGLWGSPYNPITNISKNSISPNNIIKS